MKLYDTSWQTSSFDTQSRITNQIDDRSGRRRGTGTMYDGSTYQGSDGYSVVGIDATKVSGIITEIDTYVKNIEQHIIGINENANANVAFKSDEVQAAVKAYISKVEEYCVNLTSKLNAFADKLEDVKIAYEKNMNLISGNLSGKTTQFGEGIKYTKQN